MPTLTRTRTQETAAADAVDVKLSAAGDARAFERLYRRHVPRIHSLARRMLGAAEADEATQEVFVRAWKKLSTFRGDAAFATWLHRVAINSFLAHRKSAALRAARYANDERAFSLAADRPVRTDLRVDFEAAIETLPDGALDGAERAALETHLGECGECRATLEELRAVVALAHSLEDRPPEADLWPAIAERIAAESPGETVVDATAWRRARARRVSFSLPQLAAAAIAVMLLSGSAVWLALSRSGAGPATPVATSPEPAAGSVFLAAYGFGSAYDQAVAELGRILEEGRDRLDPSTVEVLETNLRIIDQAIEEARLALERDPMNVYLNRHLADTMNRKLQFLRRAGEIVRAQT